MTGGKYVDLKGHHRWIPFICCFGDFWRRCLFQWDFWASGVFHMRKLCRYAKRGWCDILHQPRTKKAAADLSWKGGEREEGHLHNVTVLSFVHLWTCERTLPNLAFAILLFLNWIALYTALAWTLQLCTWTLPRGLLSDTSHTGICIILKIWFGIGWSQAALAWTLGTWTLPRGLLSDTSLPCMLFEIFHRSWSLHWSSFVCGGSPQLNLQGFTRHTPPALRYLASNPDKKAAADLSWKGGDREEAKIRLD